MIYDLVLDLDWKEIGMQRADTGPVFKPLDGTKVDLALLDVCKQIRCEAALKPISTSIFYMLPHQMRPMLNIFSGAQANAITILRLNYLDVRNGLRPLQYLAGLHTIYISWTPDDAPQTTLDNIAARLAGDSRNPELEVVFLDEDGVDA